MRRGHDLPSGSAGRYKARRGLPNGGHARSFQKGLIAIRKDNNKPKRVDWNKIRAEYIKGGISQRKLAAKHGVSMNTLIKKANVEKWSSQRDETYNKVTTRVQQKTANVVADNATLAAEIKRKLLARINNLIDSIPEELASTELQQYEKGKKRVFKLKDLTSMYKDLTADMTQQDETGNALLESLIALERRSSND